MICYAFPLAHEASQLLKLCSQREDFSIGRLKCCLANLGERRVLVAQIGMGQVRARESTRTILQYFRPKAFVLAGYGGALVPQMKIGQVVIANNFTSEELLPFLRVLSGFDFGAFCTSDEIAGTPEKRDWYSRSMRAQVIDMETAVVVDLVKEREIPFLAVRSISDGYRDALPTQALAAGFDAASGHATPFRLLSHLLFRPAEILPLKKFVANLSIARRTLTAFVDQINDELPRAW